MTMKQWPVLLLALLTGGCASYVADEITHSKVAKPFTVESLSTLPTALAGQTGSFCQAQLPYCVPYTLAAPYTPSEQEASVTLQWSSQQGQLAFNKVYRFAAAQAGQYHGTIILLHGHGASKESWAMTSAYFQMLGFYTLAPDLMGEGASQAPFGVGVNDAPLLNALINSERVEQLPGPVIIAGHSLGALAAVKTAQISPVQGVMLFAPMRRFDEASLAVSQVFAPFRSRFVPDANILEGVQLILERSGVSLKQTDMLNDVGKLTVPVLVYGSSEDTISNLNEQQRWQVAGATRVDVPEENHLSVVGINKTQHQAITQWLSVHFNSDKVRKK